jgi:hypothetical protein
VVYLIALKPKVPALLSEKIPENISTASLLFRIGIVQKEITHAG